MSEPSYTAPTFGLVVLHRLNAEIGQHHAHLRRLLGIPLRRSDHRRIRGRVFRNESDDLRVGLVARRGDLVLVIVCRDEPLATRVLDRILAGGVSSISAIWWMPYYPVWSLVYVLIGVLVVYALAAHGGRYKVDM